MNEYSQILQDIKGVKVQGAGNVARAGMDAFLLLPTATSAEKILSLRPTEPLLQFAIRRLLKAHDKKLEHRRILNYMQHAHQEIAALGSKLIKNNMKVFTHCHSNTVMNILKHAYYSGKRFTVYNTETYPLYQGRKTALELSNIGIKVIHTSDLGEEYCLEKSDIFLFGADAFTPRGVINKLGTSMFCELAKLHKIPCYAAGISLKFTPKVEIEMRKPEEVWHPRNKPKALQILNPAFDFTEKALVKRVISELGILRYKKFIKKSQKIFF